MHIPMNLVERNLETRQLGLGYAKSVEGLQWR
jgi:hypothetical protein